MLSLPQIAARLHARRCGRGFIARCPAHEDRHPSLSLSERDGRVLVHCHAGCAQADVIAALRERGLWLERDRPPLSPTERAVRASESAEVQRIHIESGYFARAAELMAEWALEELPKTHPERYGLTRLTAALRVSPEAEYRAWLKQEPLWAAALVHAGRARDRHWQVAFAEWIAAGMPEHAPNG
jgi:hypothetical protein